MVESQVHNSSPTDVHDGAYHRPMFNNYIIVVIMTTRDISREKMFGEKKEKKKTKKEKEKEKEKRRLEIGWWKLRPKHHTTTQQAVKHLQHS